MDICVDQMNKEEPMEVNELVKQVHEKSNMLWKTVLALVKKVCETAPQELESLY